MNPAFDRHAAYMEQAWRTMEDSLLLKYRGGGFTHEGYPTYIDEAGPTQAGPVTLRRKPRSLARPEPEPEPEPERPQVTDWNNRPVPLPGEPDFERYKKWLAEQKVLAHKQAQLPKRSKYYKQRPSRSIFHRSEGKSSALENSWNFLKEEEWQQEPSIPSTMRGYAAEGRCAKCGASCTSCNNQRREEGPRWSTPRLDQRWLDLWRNQARKDELTTPSESDKESGV